MPDYEVLLHGTRLVLLDERGNRREGGVYAWRFVSATNEEAAISRAESELVRDPAFLEELWNASADSIVFEVDEIRERPDGSPEKEASPVFYIDESD